eukprot:gene50288-68357_t
MTFGHVWSIEYLARQENIKFRQSVMYPGTASASIALTSPAHDNVISGVRIHAPGVHDESWINAALRKPLQFFVKRAIDVSVSGLVLVFLLPFFAAIAALIVYENRGPVFFSQLRWGRGGKLIRIYKFRSMRSDMCDASGVAQTLENDPRVTRIG